jgi:hypothetical protein
MESTDEKTNKYKFSNCKENHSSTSSICQIRRENQQVLEVAEKYGMDFKRARITYRNYAQALQSNLTPEKRVISKTAEDLQQLTANKLVIGILTTPGMLNIQDLELSEKIGKLCDLVEELKLGKLNGSDISMVCQVNSGFENRSNP